MSDDKVSSNAAIDAALRLDGDPDKVRAYYDDWAQNYNLDIGDAGYSGPAICARLLQECLPDAGARLLDAGCGTGLVGGELDALGYRSIDGFDLSDSMAEQARASGVYRQLAGGIDIMRAMQTFAPGSYDAVLSVGVFTLGHVPPEALTVLLQLVRPGGLLVMSTRTHYYDQSGFQQLVDELIADQQIELIKLLRDAPYNKDGAGHYWVFRKPG
ncbi:MAG: class I SAM-dependent methyltransferase [Gammaproteobacteria bacterium]|nr:class I SAM-dependent methyltransferase [Gammaproteobacteria bacterium]